MMQNLRDWARALKSELVVLAMALPDPRTPWYAWALGIVVVGYALSPIDLIPDFIPVIGLLDDVILVPLGLWAVKLLIPAAVLSDVRARIDPAARLPKSRAAAVVIVGLWLIGVVFAGIWAWRYLSLR